MGTKAANVTQKTIDHPFITEKMITFANSSLGNCLLHTTEPKVQTSFNNTIKTTIN